uniref:Integrase, catalytic region, zinc finger, CCHC-type, peptidase aspartic, catalytic n=1 Tax=Tanacetum cinerariifolium TaxID=118510 RepID=A0A6L2M084_TANCI|nr:integrase, catalytic region, zinc finger, CCHC-type, peptidase aspartic, catalytic [Tanacetum cinerariifolium]
MELYMMNRQHGRMILESVQNGLLIWPMIEENGVIRPRKYSELTHAEAIQADCDVKETNIILQGLPPEVYTLEAVQNLNSSTQQDALILSMIDKLKTQVINYTKINLDNKSVNDTLTAELERYKEQVIVFKEGQNVDLKSRGNVSDSCEQSIEIYHLKQTLSEQSKEKESLMQIVTILKNDFKKEKSRNIDREILLEKKIKQLDNIVYKRDQSAQTVHMLTKLQFFYDHTTKQALGFQNPFYLKKVQQLEPKLYDDPSPSKRLTKIEVPKELPKVSMVNTDNSVSNQSAPNFDQYFELNQLKAQSQEKDTVITKLKERIKSLSGNVNKDKEKDFVITAPKDELRKLKEKDLAYNIVTKHTIALEMLKIDVEPLAPRLLNNRTVHSDYLRLTQEQAAILQETFTIVGNACPLIRITTTFEVPLRKLIALETDAPKPVVTLVYSNKPRKSKTNVPVSKPKIIKSISANKKEPNSGCSKHMTEDRSQLTNFVNKFLGTIKFGNDHVAKIISYGDNQIGNVTISRVYYVEGLGHNLFSVGQFCDSNLELDTVLFEVSQSYLCSACAMGKSKKKSHKSKSKDTNQEKLYLLHMDLCGPIRVASVNGKKTDLDLLFQPLFDELLNPSPGVDLPTPEVIALIVEVVAPEPAKSTGLPSSTTVDQDAPSPILKNHQKMPTFCDDPLHETLHEDSTSQGSSSNMRQTHTLFESLGRWTKDHPIANVIDDPSHFVSTRKQLHIDAMWCFFNAFLTLVEPKNFKQAMTEPSWIDAMQEEIHKFERLQV